MNNPALKKKAILFGANGYLGRQLAFFLHQYKIDFIPTDLDSESIDGHENYVSIDITQSGHLSILDFQVDYVFVFAGLTGTGDSPEIIQKFTAVNEQGLLNVMVCCEGIPGLRLVFPSTRLVYKGIKNKRLKESSSKETKTIYAKNKLACEGFLEASNISYTIFRICVPYGNLIDDNYSYGTIGFFLNKASNGDRISIYGDGQLKRTFTHVGDIVKAILQTIELDESLNETYNIGSDDGLSLLEVAQLVAEKYEVMVEHIEWPAAALKIESGDTIFEDEKIKKLISYQYQFSIKDWINTI